MPLVNFYIDIDFQVHLLTAITDTVRSQWCELFFLCSSVFFVHETGRIWNEQLLANNQPDDNAESQRKTLHRLRQCSHNSCLHHNVLQSSVCLLDRLVDRDCSRNTGERHTRPHLVWIGRCSGQSGYVDGLWYGRPTHSSNEAQWWIQFLWPWSRR